MHKQKTVMFEIPRALFYTFGSLWFVININQKTWQNQILYSIYDEIKIRNKVLLKDEKKDKLV